MEHGVFRLDDIGRRAVRERFSSADAADPSPCADWSAAAAAAAVVAHLAGAGTDCSVETGRGGAGWARGTDRPK